MKQQALIQILLAPFVFFAFTLVFVLAFASTASPQIASLVSPGELSRAHSKFSGIKNCAVCHGDNKGVLDSKCLSCHKEMAMRINSKAGFHADKAANCTGCHSEHLGKDFDIRPLDRKKFDHAETGWKLEGLHQKITDCSACHKTRSFLGLSTACASCHQDPHKGRLPKCETCHSVQRPLKQVVFDHNTTKYPLTGAHQTVACLTCHKNQIFQSLPFANCTSCHNDPHKGSLGTVCASCHATESWKPVKFQHTQFPLTGKHTTVPCASCHPNGKWKLTAFARCNDCHKDPHLGQFSKTCDSCHNVDGFKPAKFDHSSFPLEQKHAAVACADCHKMEKAKFPAGFGEAIRYHSLRSDCASCHKDPHQGQLGTKCETCHSIAGFKVIAASFDHSKTRYPLDDVHAKVACNACHKIDPKTGTAHYKPIDTRCVSCHTDPHLGQLGATCERCHTPSGLQFNHATTAYPLIGRHATVDCKECHKLETGVFPAGKGQAIRYKPIATQCASCHGDYHKGQFKQDCSGCHTPEGFKPSLFQHGKSDFPLNGQHAQLACLKCHKPEFIKDPPPPAEIIRYRPIPRECSGCHTDPHQGRFGNDCKKCHTEQQWASVSLAFHKAGLFPLTGRHQSVPCQSCHLDSVIAGTPTRCYDCHWVRRQDDLYRTLLGADCSQCHNTDAWGDVTWNHAVNANVPLNAAHRALGCDSCHIKKTFVRGEVDCYSCHRQDYQSAKQPDHVAANYPTTCSACHNPGDNSWNTAPFNHNAVFPLVGVHAQQTCAACHINGRYAGTPKDCYGCHKTQYDNTSNPNHRNAGFPTTCDACHKATDPDWTRANFDHNKFYPLVGVHKQQPCASCHKNANYADTPKECYGCHKDQYDSTTKPNHRTAGFPTTCDACHKATDPDWTRANFDHNKVFPLVGVHAQQPCAACHKNGNYTNAPKECYGCHKTQYDNTTKPNHRTAGFPTTCDACHKATDPDWTRANFDHNKFFPLVGVHKQQPCAACHLNDNYTNAPKDCYGCHRAQYDSTTNPNHRTAGFPTTCDACHKASDPNWNGAKFDHNKFFPLAGVHAQQPCEACHKNGNYTNAPKDCYGCHKAQYDSTTNPNHRTAGFPTSCDACHKYTDPNWNQASFDHNKFFPLAGVHAQEPCAACHKNGNYTNAPKDCYGCHKAQYDSTTNPNHRAAGFPTTCDACHKYTDSNWNQAVFNHTWFPIQSGNHGGIPCAQCHTNPSSFAVFQCLTCHPRSEVDPHHRDVRNYIYDSHACYNCHPNGRAGD